MSCEKNPFQQATRQLRCFEVNLAEKPLYMIFSSSENANCATFKPRLPLNI